MQKKQKRGRLSFFEGGTADFSYVVWLKFVWRNSEESMKKNERQHSIQKLIV